MRPDEHKRKKNTAYKKKHGIKDAGDKKDEKTKKDKSTAESGKQERQTTKHGSETKSQPQSSDSAAGSRRQGKKDLTAAKAENSSSNASSSDSENENATSSRKTPSKLFRKRQIVSNWQKYELPPDTEEKVSARGEKFEKLLSMTGEAISHFRFKDELVWDDPGEATHDPSNDAYCEFLSVNPTELAQSLACLPVHQILGISASVFPDEQLSSMIDTAKTMRSHYITDTTEEAAGFTGHSDKNEANELTTNSRLHSSPENNKENQVTRVVTTSEYTQAVFTNSSLLSPAAPVNVQSCLTDTNTGFNAGTVGQETCNGKSDDALEHPEDKLQLQDDDLDVLLNTFGPSEVNGGDKSSILPRKAEGDSKMASESEDLEAWLDSVLDG